jgi:hypothetical protein
MIGWSASEFLIVWALGDLKNRWLGSEGGEMGVENQLAA